MQTIIKPGTSAKKINSLLKNGGEFLFKKGEYDLNKTLILYSNTLITCESGVVFNRTHSGRMVSVYIDPSITGYNGIKNVIWKGGTLKASTHKSSAIVVVICHSKNIVFDSVNVEGCVYLHSFEINSSQDVQIKNCKISKQTVKVGDEHKEAIQIDYCYKGGLSISDATETSPCYDDQHCDKITVDNCTFIDCPNGVGTHVVSKDENYHTNITIKNCKFTNIAGSAIRLLGMKNVTIENCGSCKILLDRVKKAHTSEGKVKLDTYRENRNVKIDKITVE